ncbi:MAG TPA: hypothetical protein VLK65_21735 [Vicinamibacteria bacterium]|nr:hypothetical protein [Vicinamibacteria bacterium]
MKTLAWAFGDSRRHPASPWVAVVTLALGIGANAAVFSLLRLYSTRPCTFPRVARPESTR